METKEITKEDLKNLEAIFAYARKLISDNEQELVNIINYKHQLFEKLNKIISDNDQKKEVSEIPKTE